MSEPPTLARHLALHTVAIAGIDLLALGLAGCSQEPDQPQTLAELRAEAEAGDAGSLWMLGSRYQFVDDAEAVTWYRKAAEQGPALAQASLGEMYKLGRGVPQDTAEAAAWYCKAAAAYSFIEDDISECAELSEECTAPGFLDSGLTVFASSYRVQPDEVASHLGGASIVVFLQHPTVRCMSA